MTSDTERFKARMAANPSRRLPPVMLTMSKAQLGTIAQVLEDASQSPEVMALRGAVETVLAWDLCTRADITSAPTVVRLEANRND